ncbi:MAG TPA: alpha/beta hydrolase-fold protein [Candidatus Sulfopaludibacter sp.]|jgi:enterochelin esterase family protein|nr:alpha/beta hydrolase-fold protein [Candidatus Sulfopaludibacter sp.]
MRLSFFQAAILLSAIGLNLAAQPGRGPAFRSPEVSADGKVTLRLRAPNAKDVAVTGMGERLAMQKDEQGIWTATTGVLKPDIYLYSFNVDGLSISDPANPLHQSSYSNLGPSMVTVPGPVLWEPGEGPRGVVAHHFYKSASIGDNRDYYVYTPPNYNPARKEAYPIFFVLHGLGDDAAAWLNVGAANVILDNLINQGKAAPMVMVNTLGYGTGDGPRGAMGAGMIPAYTKALLEEILPQVEKEYHVSKDRTQHAIAGLSMGGAEATYVGLNHLDQFAYVGSFSGAYVMWPRAEAAAPAPAGGRGGGRSITEADMEKNFPKLDAKAASQLRLLWIACGTSDGLIGVNRQFKTWLKAKNVPFTEVEVPGMAHVWPLWRENLAELAPLLFRGK